MSRIPALIVVCLAACGSSTSSLLDDAGVPDGPHVVLSDGAATAPDGTVGSPVDANPASPDAPVTSPDATVSSACTPMTSTIAHNVNHATVPVVAPDGTVTVLYEPTSFGVVQATLAPGATTWQLAPVQDPHAVAMMTTSDKSVVLDAEGGLHAAFFDPSGGGLSVGYRPAGGAWQLHEYDNMANRPVAEIGLIADNRVAVAYDYNKVTSPSGLQMRLIVCSFNGNNCSQNDVAFGASLSPPSMVIGPSGTVYVGYTFNPLGGVPNIAAVTGEQHVAITPMDVSGSVDGESHLALLPGSDAPFDAFEDRFHGFIDFGQYPHIADGSTTSAEDDVVYNGTVDMRGRIWWQVTDAETGTTDFYYRRETNGSLTPVRGLPWGNLAFDGAGGMHVITLDNGRTLTYHKLCGE
jgi:hypothetical protein